MWGVVSAVYQVECGLMLLWCTHTHTDYDGPVYCILECYLLETWKELRHGSHSQRLDIWARPIIIGEYKFGMILNHCITRECGRLSVKYCIIADPCHPDESWLTLTMPMRHTISSEIDSATVPETHPLMRRSIGV